MNDLRFSGRCVSWSCVSRWKKYKSPSLDENLLSKFAFFVDSSPESCEDFFIVSIGVHSMTPAPGTLACQSHLVTGYEQSHLEKRSISRSSIHTRTHTIQHRCYKRRGKTLFRERQRETETEREREYQRKGADRDTVAHILPAHTQRRSRKRERELSSGRETHRANRTVLWLDKSLALSLSRVPSMKAEALS